MSEYEIRSVGGHVEVYTRGGVFLFSADTVREAFALARSGRPGPVVIDITRDVTSAECDYEPLPLEQHAATGHLASLIRRAYTSSLKMPEADLDDVEKLVEMIAESKKPMLICGGSRDLIS